MDVAHERRVRPAGQEGRAQGAPSSGRGGARGRPARGVRRPPAEPALRRAAAARRPGPGPGQPAQGAAARRAARRARPQAAPRDAARAQADPARGRHHLRLRHPRPGGGAVDERPGRGLQRRARSSRWPRPVELYEHPGEPVRRRLRRHVQPDRRRGGPSRSSGATATSPSVRRSCGSPHPARRSTPTRSRRPARSARSSTSAPAPTPSSSSTPALASPCRGPTAAPRHGPPLEVSATGRSLVVFHRRAHLDCHVLSGPTARNPGEEAMTNAHRDPLPALPRRRSTRPGGRLRHPGVVVVRHDLGPGGLHPARRPDAAVDGRDGGRGQHPGLAGLRRGRLDRHERRLGDPVRAADRLQGQREVLRDLRRGRQPDEDRRLRRGVGLRRRVAAADRLGRRRAGEHRR